MGYEIIAIVCSLWFECLEFEQKDKKFFKTFKECKTESEWIGQDIYNELHTKLGIPFDLKLYCKETKKWQV